MNSEQDDTEEFLDQDLFESEEEPKLTILDHLKKAFKVLIALVAIVGLVYLSGIYQSFRYARTPVTIEQEQTEALFDAEDISVPMTVYVIRNEGVFGSKRTKEDITRLIVNADVIWDQAHVNLAVTKRVELELTDADVEQLLNDPHRAIQRISEYSLDTINIFLIKSLHGINGLAISGISGVFVADFTTVIDFRTFAHEIGHILGLAHVPGDRGRLMYRGANGFELTVDEVMRARERAEMLF